MYVLIYSFCAIEVVYRDFSSASVAKFSFFYRQPVLGLFVFVVVEAIESSIILLLFFLCWIVNFPLLLFSCSLLNLQRAPLPSFLPSFSSEKIPLCHLESGAVLRSFFSQFSLPILNDICFSFESL